MVCPRWNLLIVARPQQALSRGSVTHVELASSLSVAPHSHSVSSQVDETEYL